MTTINAFLCLTTMLIHTYAIRLNKLFQYLDGYKFEDNLRGFLHIGTDYAVFLRVPKSHAKYLEYELYEAKNMPERARYKPKLLAISRVPVEYIKDQLRTFKEELYNAKYVNNNTIPGTQVQTVREWQIAKALDIHKNGRSFQNDAMVLRTIL
ncbi:hypothetical protein ACJJTC_003827 [Scirpophaga incertulas]